MNHELIRNGKVIGKINYSKLTIFEAIQLVALGYSFGKEVK